MKSKALCMTAVVVAALLAGSAFAGQAGKVDISGKWLFNVETSAGSGTPSITLKQDGDKLTGHYSGQLGESDLTGTISGAEFTFKFTVDAQGNKLDNTYKGTVDGKDALKGTVNIAGLADGTFTAKKQ